MKAVVNIALRSGVLDPAGKAVEHALNSLGFSGVSNVRIGKQIVLDIDESDKAKANEQLKVMCEELLANTVIEDYEIVL
ncbi:phosphoribosylformylglycinamidine synthase subunit PurS [Campylobacter concisus]|jgi:phosphoribosylformylglycinamidine synthase, purS protein|uniref:Phosphoribosylformylglycinamidine synthase subunit PurS n=3 Tax=Campylobacter concisus TaxID=199 RepID=A0AAE7TP92_9BACT|nr:phosphoribosylformylglycinamidine synthase subunit PurS [Campylobacter concisus]ERJ25626.1 Phosphoribosylformylglycinamidine synthase, PurS subunit [Campylobacter concisus ATCC 51562]ORI04040.1 phosphoribosylformylglycinamidine synthase [Campylobacter concisus]ORI11684.1 phosphoribosylformylglycinamidine synthase [Campylobacter concisus]OUT14175.1 phosphoribosylformylglycinamidine synthase subunit PurS [Campylobacter concisus]QPH86350.1 phosphoribosylformylglycinamidine synthase subunit Pur